MIRILPSFAAALAACTPSPEETAMHSPSQHPGTSPGPSSTAGAGIMRATERPAGDQQRAALGPAAEPVSAAQNPAPLSADSHAEAEGRRTLSTAFVMVGPDGHLTVELRGGRVLVLRDVVMRRKDYCGVQALGGQAGERHCGGYADIAAARPGGQPVASKPDLAAPNRLEAPGKAVRRD